METAFEHILMNFYKAQMIAHMKSNPEDFEEAMNLSLSNKQPYSWRAAWLLWSCLKKNDPRLEGYIKKIIDSMPSKADGHQRELLKILQLTEINEEYEAYLLDMCVDIWKQVNKKPSVRFNAFIMMVKIAKKHPGLSSEIKLLTQSQYLDTLSPGVQRSVERMIRRLEVEIDY